MVIWLVKVCCDEWNNIIFKIDNVVILINCIELGVYVVRGYKIMNVLNFVCFFNWFWCMKKLIKCKLEFLISICFFMFFLRILIGE